MKFWAKLGISRNVEAENLIRAFFKEFNPESSIVIRGKEGKVEIIFDKSPPMKIIEAVNHCEVIEFNFGKELGVYSESKETETSEEPEKVEEEEETSEEPEKAEEEEETSEEPEKVEEEEETSEEPEKAGVYFCDIQ